METVNITLKLNKSEVVNFENWIRNNVEVIDFNIMADTDNMWQNCTHFKKLIKAKKDLTLEIDRYVNENNHKYK